MTTYKTPTEALAQLRHLYAQLKSQDGMSRTDRARIADGILSPAIAALEKWGQPSGATEEVENLRKALVYAAFALHDTPQYMLAQGMTLIDGDTVRVSRDGWTVEASVNPHRQPAPATQQAREVSDAMVLAALQVQHPAAYGQYLRHPANGPKTSIRTEAEIDTARRMIAAALAAAPQPSPTAQSADSVPAVSDLPPLPAPDLRDVGTKPQEIKEFLKGYATEYARTAIAARAQAGAVPLDEARRLFDAGWKAAAMLCDREDVVADGIIGFGACPQFESAFSAAQPVAREPLTPEQIQDLLLCGNPTDEEMRLIRIGWDAARGIKGDPHG